MIKCEECGQEFYKITESHLKKHNLTTKEYIEKYPDASLKSKEIKPVKKIKQRFKIDKPKLAALPVYEAGERWNIPCNVPTKIRFKNYREEKGWTILEALNKLIDHDIELDKLKEKQKESEDLKKITEDLPENFTAFHRDQLQRILKVLEEKAFNEMDTSKLATIADKIAKINQILPTLDRSYDSDVDAKIRELTEKRKAICLNYLYEDKAMPWSIKK